MQMPNSKAVLARNFHVLASRIAPDAYKEALRRHGLGCASCGPRGLGDSGNAADYSFSTISADTGTPPDYSFDSSFGPTMTSTAGTPSAATVTLPSAATIAASPSIWAQVADTFTKLAPAALNLINTNSCTQTNIARAKIGQPPIDCSAVAPTATVGLTTQTSSLVMFGIAAFAAVAIFSASRKRA